MPSQNSKEISGQVKAAIIGGVFALLAAIVGGVFLILNTMVDKGTILSSTPTANAPSKEQINSAIQNLNERGLLSSTNGSLLWDVNDYQVAAPDQAYQTSFPSEIQVADFVLFGEFTWSAKAEDLPYCGFTFRGDEGGKGNFYTTFLGADKGVVLWLHSGNDYLPFNVSLTLETADNTKNKLILIAKGNEFTLLVNDIVAYQTSDSTFSVGRVGLSAGIGKKPNVCTFTNAWLWQIK